MKKNKAAVALGQLGGKANGPFGVAAISLCQPWQKTPFCIIIFQPQSFERVSAVPGSRSPRPQTGSGIRQHAAINLEAVGQHALGRKLGEIFEHVHLVRPMAQEQFHMLLFLGSAEDEPHRFVLALAPFVLLEPREIQVHPPLVGGNKWPNLQINGHEAA